jgi:hypothetical protein
MGIGGGGDVIQAIPIANQLRLLGVQDLLIGGVGCSWWMPPQDGCTGDPSAMIVGPTIYDVNRLQPVQSWAPLVVGVEHSSNYLGFRPAEATLAEMLPGTPFVAGLTGGAVGLADSLRKVITDRSVDFVVAVDTGSDSFHDGEEVARAHSSLVDFVSLAALTQLHVPVVFALAGYGADGEMQLEELDQRVGRVMRAGGYLGAMGPSQRDVEDTLRACALFPDPILPVASQAAQGVLGLRCVHTYSPWGTVIRVTPLAATILLFDPHVLVEVVCKGVSRLQRTRSLGEVEAIYRDILGELPETQLKQAIQFFQPARDQQVITNEVSHATGTPRTWE